MIQRVCLNRELEIQRGYNLPFRNGQVKISQGFNGPWSHFAFKKNRERFKNELYDFSFSVDFEVPLGTQVRAAKDGVQCGCYNGEEIAYEGLDENIGWGMKTNFVFLRHADRMFTCYSHLNKTGFRFKDGARVRQGEVIAETGASGWIGPKPHLHFCVFNMVSDDFYLATFPFVFENYQGSLEHSEL